MDRDDEDDDDDDDYDDDDDDRAQADQEILFSFLLSLRVIFCRYEDELWKAISLRKKKAYLNLLFP